MQAGIWQEQEWESVFFGFRVARIFPPFTFQQATDALLSLTAADFSFLYGFVDPASPEQHILEQLGGKVIATRATYSMPVSDIQTPSVARIATQNDLPELEILALQSGLYSRYRKDVMFPEVMYEKMYRTWVRNTLEKTFGDEVLVIEEDGTLAGMVTMSKSGQLATVGLFVVLNIFRRQGIGKGLLDAAMEWSRQQGCKELRVITQLENRPACRFYSGRGFELLQVENAVHLWL
ncbi:MAG: GNAT family N-acetyltransferase [Chitinophagales bacterium]|nr:GNAT family N-acetyltransferase [Chitinophagales bacterium]MCB9021349.1 GNAT family N-acetyltransferase [Chitinophagales bacterium]HPE97858.1 GNAT family N-acetyltransferase [Chitinophagales bacterium]HPR28572.1 GNAT family N-acetyltransferase [Chitinophagales bacterium]HQU39934.1 GNAT family N-acetyltransferase [Chitinophagales bacterium]